MSLPRKCRICKTKFMSKPFHIKNGGGIYCSRDCHYKGLRRGRFVKCSTCSKEIYKPPKAFRQSKSGKFFCDKSCQTKWRNSEFIGEKHANWVHGRFAYKSVLRRNKIPSVCKLCNNRDTRVLAVHHIDEDKKNNKLRNLVWLCHNCHHLVHHDKVERERLLKMVPMV